MTGPDEFRERVASKYATEFELHDAVTGVMERLVGTPRYHQDLVARAVDMLFVQAFKALVGVHELASLALVEDGATIVRRLLELAVQAVYIARDSEEETRTQRAGMFLAFLWHKWPVELRQRLPRDERQAWETLYATHGAGFTADRKSWGPKFAQMFAYAEHSDTYAQDYSYLSNIAHGSPPNLVHDYSKATVAIHDDRLVPHVLVYANRYALATTMVWNDVFHVAAPDELIGLRDRLLQVQ